MQNPLGNNQGQLASQSSANQGSIPQFQFAASQVVTAPDQFAKQRTTVQSLKPSALQQLNEKSGKNPASTCPSAQPQAAPQILLPAQPQSVVLLCLAALSRIHKVPFDIELAAREFALQGTKDDSPEMLMRLAKSRGFRCKIVRKKTLIEVADSYRLPAVEISTNEHSIWEYRLWLSSDRANKKALYWDPASNGGGELDLPEAEKSWIVVYPRDQFAQVKFGLGWFFDEVMKYKSAVCFVMLGSFLVQLGGVVTPLLTQLVLDKVITHGALDTLQLIGAMFLTITFVEFMGNVCRNNIFSRTANKVDVKLGAKLFKHLFSLPFYYFETRRVGDTLSKVREMETVRNFITQKSVSVIVDVVFASVYVILMLTYSVQLTLVVLGFTVALAAINVIVTPTFRNKLEEKFQMGAKNNSFLVEALTGVQTIKALSVEGSMQRKWEDSLGEYINKGFSLSLLVNFISALATVFQRMMTVTVLYFGVRMVLDNQLTVGGLIAFNMFAGQLTAPILRLTSLWQELQQCLIAIDRVGDILHHPVENDNSRSIVKEKLFGHIKFDKVSFRYGATTPLVLNELSIEIPVGTCVGIVGRSGSGKSTLTKLVQQLYLPTTGSVLIDGINGSQLSAKWLRSKIGVVLQDNFLFNISIRDNIALAKPDATPEEVMNAAMLAGATEFINDMPEGFDTMVEERGASLSGGQRQRIAIARALLTNPQILILDEATSALDYESERIIKQNLNKIRKGRTVIIIAHRLTTVQSCDQIIVLDKGKVVENGSHKELLRKSGLYAYLFKQQEAESFASA
ncbi:MAG: type I secretion system permease/ATPase [Candidatus Obscuribacterales bacterium]|jgi:subfamily B ATP-binding cassette protein HlyB/CyaB|nr:type I secretion system permease/ATPase [Candidatus Obscuribacterales bacterium]